MSGHCDFCGIWHSGSCCHPGRVLLYQAEARAEKAEARVTEVERVVGSHPPEDVIEALAAYAHNAWSGWMRYLFEKSPRDAQGQRTIPADWVARWQRQIDLPYSELREDEKESDRKEARRMLAELDRGVVGVTPPPQWEGSMEQAMEAAVAAEYEAENPGVY